MPREILTHKIAGLNDAIIVKAYDGPGHGGASHVYGMFPSGHSNSLRHQSLVFQEGPVLESGPNGISNEALIAVVIDRLQGFQGGDFACPENAQALTKLEEAMHWLHHRTRARLLRGVEGTSQV